MKISIGCDHGAFEYKDAVVKHLVEVGHEVVDYGTFNTDSVDYPDFAYRAAKDVADNKVDRGIVMCTTGIGVSITANKVKGVRCALVDRVDIAQVTREHNDSNCLALGQKLTDLPTAIAIVDTWLNTEFSNLEKHARRVEKIRGIEKGLD
ncbi:MAG: ribose 5-phosphate isomerase B [Erysipelotrichaceae bacterium]